MNPIMAVHRASSPLCRQAINGALLAFLLALSAAHVAAASKPVGGSLVDCLRDKGIDVITGADGDAYYQASEMFSKLFVNYPSAIAYPNNTEGVAAAVKCAAKYRAAVHPRCGGHGNEGESVSTGALTIDLSRLAHVDMSEDKNFVTVGAGTRVGQVIAALWEQSNGTRAFPGGQRPTVGISGYTLGGGFGSTTRYAGLGGDNLVALTAVDGRGRILRADQARNSDLLWASRGGGGGRIAIVTEFEFRTMDVSSNVTQISAVIPREDAVAAVKAWQEWQPTLPNRFTMRADYTNNTADGQVSVDITGWCIGGLAECLAELEATLPREGPLADIVFRAYEEEIISTINDLYLQAVVNGIGWDAPAGYSPLEAMADPEAWTQERSYYKYKTVILQEPLPEEGIQAVLDYASGGTHGTRVFEFQSLGGAMAQVPKLASAASNLRSAQAVLILRANSKDMQEAQLALRNATLTLTKLVDIVPYRYTAYVNFLDTDIVALGDWQSAYYGDALDGLQCADAKYDPYNLFQLPLDLAAGVQRKDAGSSECKQLLRKLGAEAAAWSRHLMGNAPARG